ncbi:MAG TPA: glycosyltransferase family 4 protein [Bacteroidota bacterium]|nr:glycosyltransferase family 4 protein [Bacteroidota bacterium]
MSKRYRVNKQIGHGVFNILKIVLKVFHSDLIFCWFASVYASIAVALGKFLGIKSIIVVGGVDVAKDKNLGYGIWLNPWKAKLVRYALHNADRVLVVDPSLGDDAISLAEYDGKNITYLPTGYDSSFWKPLGEKERLVLTVAVVHDIKRLKLKGIDLLIQAAEKLPELQFLVIGVNSKLASSLKYPSNMTFHEPIARDDLLPYYRQAKVYCQPSLREGLPNTLCEAMLCGCIPVASEVGGNTTAIGDTGILIPPNDVDALTAALKHAMKLPDNSGAKARARVVALFPKQKREIELHRIIDELMR